MPFVTDIYPPAKDIEAAAGLGLTMGARKSKGFFGKKQYEAVEVLSCFSLSLGTIAWDKGEKGSTGFVYDPQGMICGSLRFDLAAGGPDAEFEAEMIEEEFLTLCQQLAKSAAEFKAETIEIPGLISDPRQAEHLLKEDDQDALAAGLEKTVDPGKIVEDLRNRLAQYDHGANAWIQAKQQAFNHRDKLAEKINEAVAEAKAAGDISVQQLEGQIKAAVAAKRQEIEELIAKARQDSEKEKEVMQSELQRAKEHFEQDGTDYWRDQIKNLEERIAEHDKDLAKAVSDRESELEKYQDEQQNRMKQLESELEKRMAAFEQRRKRLDSTLESLEKNIDKRVERCREQSKKVSAHTITLTPEQTDKEMPVLFYAARYPGDRWQVFPPQLFGDRGLRGKFASLIGSMNLPFKPASKLAETLASKLQEILPGHELEGRLVEQNLLQDGEFISDAKAGLAKLIDQGDVDKKHADLFAQF